MQPENKVKHSKTSLPDTILHILQRESRSWLVIASMLLLMACSTASKPQQTPLLGEPTPTPLHKLPKPPVPSLKAFRWEVLSQERQAEAEQFLSRYGALVCVSPSGYEDLAGNVASLKGYIIDLQELVRAYEKQVDHNNGE